MTPQWRLIVDDRPGSGAWNMSLDRAIQLSHSAGASPPTLRLYRWERPTITLGRFQDSAGIDDAVCRRRGVDVVRRFTGGRGVLHDDELTYSVVAGTRDGVPKGVAASYNYLCAALVAAYDLLGVSAQLTPRPRGDASSAACYMHATHADVSVGISKLSGSAQVWSSDTVLQHGSFTRTRNIALESEVFRLSSADSRRLAATTTTMGELNPVIPEFAQIVAAVVEGFSSALGVRFTVGAPTRDEISTANTLQEQVLLTEQVGVSSGIGIVKVEP